MIFFEYFSNIDKINNPNNPNPNAEIAKMAINNKNAPAPGP